MLIAHGHRPAEVWGYTMRAVQAYVDLIQMRLQQQLHDLTVAMRHSQGMDAKVFREFLKGLSGE